MKHLNPARVLASKRGAIRRILSLLLFVNLISSTHSGDAASSNGSHFIDPSAIVDCDEHNQLCSFGSNVYIGPFATLKTGVKSRKKTPSITIGNDSNVQDNTLLDATNGAITLGDRVIIAHGAYVYGGARIGVTGECPSNIPICASFVGFNSEVDETAVVERNAMVTHLARVGRGVTIPSGRVVLPGVYITSPEEVPAKTVEITRADQEFMAEVISVNIALTAGYLELQRQPGDKVRGYNVNPATDWARSMPPTLGGTDITDPNKPNRIIGDVQFSGTAMPELGSSISVRADEGTPFTVGEQSSLASYTTFHALKETQLRLGAHGRYGVGSLMHGGKFNDKVTSTGRNFELGNDSVFYSSTAADNCRIGAMSFVADTDLKPNTVIPAKVVVLGGTRCQVEWERGSDKKPTKSRGNRQR